MTSSTVSSLRPAPVAPGAEVSRRVPWELSALRHHRLRAGDLLRDATGPLWVLVLDGTATLETARGVEQVGVGDAVLIGPRTAYRLGGAEDVTLAVGDLRPVVPSSAIPSPLVVRDFARRHHGVTELVRTCPLNVECSPGVFASSYGGLIGASMVTAWLEAEGRDGQESADPAIDAVLAAVADHPADQWTVERMADLVHLSRSSLGERFRRQLGRSPVQVLRDIRMQQARRLLSDHRRPVEQIGHAVGYGSAAAFTRAFTAHHGVAPNAWRAASTA
jgi:AraC-like DNA-binding protein